MSEKQPVPFSFHMKPIIKKIWVPLLLFSIDVLVIGGGNVGALASLFAVPVFFIKAIVAVYKNEKADFVEHISKMAVYAVTLAAIVFALVWNNKIAGRKAELIIGALEKYKAENAQYPDKLEALIPKYLPVIPRAKIGLKTEYNTFVYTNWDGKHCLRFYSAPPFGVQVYHAEEKQWSFVD